MELHLNYGGTSHTLDLNDGSYTLGRSENSQIRIPVMSVSRQHAILRVEGETLHIRNLSTTSGTLLDGRQIETEEELEIPKQSRLTFGEAELWRDEAVTSFGAPLSEHDELRSRFSFSPDRKTTGMARDRILQMLSSLFDLIAAAPDDESFEKNACQFVGKVVHADRVLILEDDGLGTPFQRRGAWFSSPDHADKYRLSQHFIEEVCRTKSSLLIEDAMNAGPAAAYQSVQDLRVRSALIAPLLDGDRVRGILYADNLITRRRYEEEDLQVLTAIARAVGVKRQRDDERRERGRAARVQESLLPRKLPAVEGLEIHGHLEMCQGVGGDLYLCVCRPSGRLLLAVGDVSGKGMAAALSM
ncbi:MAG TPA: FHA domain-containing protein, partial [Candidatus Krumholzibacteria bacterium]|nr:FHA domain-containing protein [Candidatus Krumholzibacteria bacterium]